MGRQAYPTAGRMASKHGIFIGDDAGANRGTFSWQLMRTGSLRSAGPCRKNVAAGACVDKRSRDSHCRDRKGDASGIVMRGLIMPGTDDVGYRVSATMALSASARRLIVKGFFRYLPIPRASASRTRFVSEKPLVMMPF